MGKTSSKQKTSSIVATDYGSPELAKRFTVVPKLTASNGYQGKVLDDSEIDRLLLNDTISAVEYSLLVALLHKLHRATFVGLKSPDFNGVAHSDPSRIAARKANAVMSVCYIVKGMDKAMGKQYRIALIDLVLLDIPWPFDVTCLRTCVRALDGVLTEPRSQTSVPQISLTPQSPAPAKAVGR